MTVDAPDKSMRMSGIQGLRLDPPLAEVRQSPGTPEMSRMRGCRPAPVPRGAGNPKGPQQGRLQRASSIVNPLPTDRTETETPQLNKTPACL